LNDIYRRSIAYIAQKHRRRYGFGMTLVRFWQYHARGNWNLDDPGRAIWFLSWNTNHGDPAVFRFWNIPCHRLEKRLTDQIIKADFKFLAWGILWNTLQSERLYLFVFFIAFFIKGNRRSAKLILSYTQIKYGLINIKNNNYIRRIIISTRKCQKL
jgi:hypothetical protein